MYVKTFFVGNHKLLSGEQRSNFGIHCAVAKKVRWSKGIGIAINLIVFSFRPADLKSPDTSRSEMSASKGGVL